MIEVGYVKTHLENKYTLWKKNLCAFILKLNLISKCVDIVNTIVSAGVTDDFWREIFSLNINFDLLTKIKVIYL